MMDQTRVRALFEYSPETGAFLWRERPLGDFKSTQRRNAWHQNLWNSRFAGKTAGTNNSGYRKVVFEGRSHYVHRLIWLYVHGKWPDEEIDHINGKRDDNRIANLREATRTDNAQNLKKPKHNTSGVIGVSWHKQSRKWAAQIRVGGEDFHLGKFPNFEDAVAVRVAAEIKHGFSPNHGRAA